MVEKALDWESEGLKVRFLVSVLALNYLCPRTVDLLIIISQNKKFGLGQSPSSFTILWFRSTQKRGKINMLYFALR